MRESDRFEVRAADGRTWRFALLERQVSAGGQVLPGGQEFVSLDAPDRYYINKIGGERFSLVDFQTDAPSIEVERI